MGIILCYARQPKASSTTLDENLHKLKPFYKSEDSKKPCTNGQQWQPSIPPVVHPHLRGEGLHAPERAIQGRMDKMTYPAAGRFGPDTCRSTPHLRRPKG